MSAYSSPFRAALAPNQQQRSFSWQKDRFTGEEVRKFQVSLREDTMNLPMAVKFTAPSDKDYSEVGRLNKESNETCPARPRSFPRPTAKMLITFTSACPFIKKIHDNTDTDRTQGFLAEGDSVIFLPEHSESAISINAVAWRDLGNTDVMVHRPSKDDQPSSAAKYLVKALARLEDGQTKVILKDNSSLYNPSRYTTAVIESCGSAALGRASYIAGTISILRPSTKKEIASHYD